MSSEIEKAAVSASNNADEIEAQVEELIQFRDIASGTDTGRLTYITKPISEMLRDVGINVIPDREVNMRQLFEANQNALALRFRNPSSGFGLTGSTSDRDVMFLQSIGPNLANTPDANWAVGTILIAKQRRKALLEREKANYLFENNTLKGWGSTKSEIVKATPFFLPDEEVMLSRITGAQPPSGDIPSSALRMGVTPEIWGHMSETQRGLFRND